MRANDTFHGSGRNVRDVGSFSSKHSGDEHAVFRVALWSAEDMQFQALIASTSSFAIARSAYIIAVSEYPGTCIILRERSLVLAPAAQSLSSEVKSNSSLRRHGRLTNRERDVLSMVLKGYTIKETARRLGITTSNGSFSQVQGHGSQWTHRPRRIDSVRARARPIVNQ